MSCNFTMQQFYVVIHQLQLWYKKPPILFTRESPYHIFIFPARRVHAARARAPSSDLRQTNSVILKVPDGTLKVLDMDSCARGTVIPMEPPMS